MNAGKRTPIEEIKETELLLSDLLTSSALDSSAAVWRARIVKRLEALEGVEKELGRR